MSKTPVMLLNELSMKHNFSLTYEEPIIIAKLNGPQFEATVRCSNHTEVGTGTTKKSAKHDAATKMLQFLKDIKKIGDVPISPVKTNGSFEKTDGGSVETSETEKSEDYFANYIGILNEYCQEHKLPFPNYKEITKGGPLHKPYFIVSCTVGSISKDGTASTKQKAKHKSAWEVLTALKGSPQLIPDKKIELSNSALNTQLKFLNSVSRASELGLEIHKKTSEEEKALADSIKLAEEQYQKVKGIQSANPETVSEQHLALRDIVMNIPEKDKVNLLDLHSKQASVPTQLIEQTIVRALEIPFKKTYLKTRRNDTFIVAVKLSTTPVIVQIGLGDSHATAENNATRKILDSIIFYLQ